MPAVNDDGATSKGKVTTTDAPWDPAAVPPAGPTLRQEEERQFHATHFTADPRGMAMKRPGGPARRRKHRGGTPPESHGEDEPALGEKRRGGSPPH